MQKKILVAAVLAQFSCFTIAVEKPQFDASLFQGSVNVDRYLNNDSDLSNYGINGTSTIDLYLNGKLVKANFKIRSAMNPTLNKFEGCLSLTQLEMLRIPDPKQVLECYFVSDLIPSSSWKFEPSNFKLDYTIPQASLIRQRDGYIDPSKWDEGISALFIKHNSNYYFTQYDNSDNSQYLSSNLKVGSNIGLWQFRHDGFVRISDDEYDYNTLNTYVQRPISSIGSNIILGESYTSEGLFGSLSYTGIKLETDKRMWPQSQLGYAPEVNGVALTNALVSVMQNGQIIREITVPPGPFVINDLNDTKNNGDLQVIIRESDGVVNTFTVPYSSVPLSVRPGNEVFNIVTGKIRGYDDVNSWFAQGTIQHGVSNQLTLNSGVRIGKDYQSYMSGGVLATSIGAFGFKGTYAFTQAHESEPATKGWQLETSFSRSFDTGMHLSLLAYRYSSAGYMELVDVLSRREQISNGATGYISDTFNQRNRFTVSLSQSLAEFGSLNMSGSLVDYYDQDKANINYQATYNNNWNSLSYNLSVGRQFSFTNSTEGKYETTMALGVSIPFDAFDRWSTVGFNYTKSDAGESATINVAGTIGEKAQASYSAYAGYESGNNAYGANMSTRTRYGNLSFGAASGEGYNRVSAGMSGTVIAHSGGLTFGPYVSDSFALVHAEGGEGLQLLNGQGAQIDGNGYAIYPSLMSYRYSDVALGATADTYSNVDLNTSSKKVVPYAGAVVKVSFETITGYAMLISTTLENGEYPPMGADAFDDSGMSVGMVGQAGQVYVRLNKSAKGITLHWNDNKECFIPINLTLLDKKAPLNSYSQTCETIK
ncbi:fimbria/pilus outer membrane usher protein [Vibrio sp. TH_r3]|uniref:fimbria/pilus outer membrane usher protein n=1 Tax=Vibrio sp. TH_r3 TaxID=3082084 RepID=UPI002952EB40|nr:fimbria/pilus outer membrane usher protein [Vibrio sp. TH_r3]MDV7104488.1 fimbria/pilus outer membrane usher protein [Vibrio sp. TH_r3]